jgi:DNA-binding transcriptional LysR family regulator
MPGHFECRPFFRETRKLVVHEGHPDFQRLLDRPARFLASQTLLTSYLDEAGKRPGTHRIRDMVQDVWEVSHLELRLALCAAGKGVTYLSDTLLSDLSGFHPIEGLEVSDIDREVGLYYKKHKALSEGAKKFIGICQRAFNPMTG